ncbi:uncharacterized protein CG5098 isoform X2 [Cephus cinctus]|uniref:Uncharacterized protein CG5098 isoform X2 n=1 Tax=Cephus cinctus TaxID=211228 RepID=A0AAJ7RVJ1_CEPCN|nr:uncharacterized protein CG5098 isoform X2 [Cephus cinctus]XP_024947489.1 uncharacterized protein CG5098 isoform X2 [Cephus cinctus]
MAETKSTNIHTAEVEDTTLGSLDRLPYDRRFYQDTQHIKERQPRIEGLQHGVTSDRSSAAPSNGLPILGNAPQWAPPTNYVQRDYQQSLVAPEDILKAYESHIKSINSEQEGDINTIHASNILKAVQTAYNLRAGFLSPDLGLLGLGALGLPGTWSWQDRPQSLDTQPEVREHQSLNSYPEFGSTWQDSQAVSQSKSTNKHTDRKASSHNFLEGHPDIECARKSKLLLSHSHESKHGHADRRNSRSLLQNDTNLAHADEGTKERKGSAENSCTETPREHSTNLENYCYTKYGELACGLLKHSDLADPTLTHRQQKSSRGSAESSRLNVDRGAGIKTEKFADEEVNRIDDSSAIKVCKLPRNSWEDFDMAGQYPGHSRPPVGTPPPQTVWNHLTMTQGQVSGLNIHPTALSGAALNPAGFYTHPSMARASHLTSQLTPQLAHTQAPPTWHTPTIPSKTVTPANAPGNPLFSLQMLVDNRQNQSQYRNSPGSQSTLDLSATSEMAENYSRIPQDTPISLTARSVDKGSRNGNIISPPIPLNGETSSDSGISSSVPTPNSVSEPVSLSTKEIITPKITVKNFESNLQGVANLHDKIKEISVDSFAQKVINLPPSVTIERVVTEKKEPEVTKIKDSLSVIAQVPRNVLPVIVNLTSKTDKDVTDSPRQEPSSEKERKIDETSVRSPKNLPKRGSKKGVDSLLEKLEGGNKKLGVTENIGSVIVMPLEEKDTCSVKSMSPERQKSKSPNREDEVVSPAFSNDDSNDNTKQRRKRKLEKPVRLSKDSKTEVEDMELEPTEPTEPRVCEPPAPSEPVVPVSIPVKPEESIERVEKIIEERIEQRTEERTGERTEERTEESTEDRAEENQPIRRRRSSEGPATILTPTNQRARRKSSDDATEFSKVTSPKGVNNANPFNEVESELEKMFAGIVETDVDLKKEEEKQEVVTTDVKDETVLKVENSENNSVVLMTETEACNPTDVSSTVDSKPSPKKGKKAKGRGGKRKISRSSENIFGTSGGGETPQKDIKKRRASKAARKQEVSKKTKKNAKIDGLREIAYDSGSNASSIRSRGPVVHVEGPRDSPLSVQVVNAPREDEEEKNKEKRKSIGNGNAGRSKRLSHQNDLDYRGKVSRAGLFSSTLSSRYDAHTTDSTWVCVFCKQGPHCVVPGDPSRPHPNLAGPHIAPGTYTVPAGVLSDLFGPYLIGKERLEDGILSADEQEISTEQKKGGKNKRSIRYAGLADQFSAKMGKKKRNSIESNINAVLFTGMTLLPGEEQRWEVWLHEQCAVWAAGVYMAGGRVTGLQEAVWDAAKSVCGACGLTGANIGCVKRGCKAVTHYPCALTRGWLLDTNQYIPKCNLHRVT